MTKLSFTDKGVEADHGGGTAKLHPWDEVAGLFFPFFGRRPYIRVRGHARLPLEFEGEALRSGILGFYAKWTEKFPSQARKNAFDYSESQASGAILVLSISVLFCFLLAGVLFQETWTQATCSRLLTANAIVQPAELVRLRKRQQGNFTVSLKFLTAAGESVEGKRLTMRKFEAGDADPKEFSVIYPPERPSCWILGETFGQNDINWAKRRYTTAFNFLVAVSFFIVGLAGAVTSLIRLRQKRPAAKEVAERFRLILD